MVYLPNTWYAAGRIQRERKRAQASIAIITQRLCVRFDLKFVKLRNAQQTVVHAFAHTFDCKLRQQQCKQQFPRGFHKCRCAPVPVCPSFRQKPHRCRGREGRQCAAIVFARHIASRPATSTISSALFFWCGLLLRGVGGRG